MTTAGGTSGSVNFTVTTSAPPPTAPTLASINPNSGTQGATINVTLTGTNFSTGASINVSGNGPGTGSSNKILVSNVNVASSTSITATFAIGAGVTTGAHGITVTTASGTSNAVTFTVN